MSVHIWAITAPPWYVADQLPDRMKVALGAQWTLKTVDVQVLRFMNKKGRDYKMSVKMFNNKASGSALLELLNRAVKEKAHTVCLVVDVNIMDAK